jgi:hypothetical protein
MNDDDSQCRSERIKPGYAKTITVAYERSRPKPSPASAGVRGMWARVI